MQIGEHRLAAVALLLASVATASETPPAARVREHVRAEHYVEAEAAARAWLEAARPSSTDEGRASSALAEARTRLGRSLEPETLAAAERSVELFEARAHEDLPAALEALRTLGRVRASRGDLDGALSDLRRAHELAERHEAGPRELARTLLPLGSVLLVRGKLPEAGEHLERAARLVEEAEAEDPGTTDALLRIDVTLANARHRSSTGDYERARALAERVIADSASVWGDGSLRSAGALTVLAEIDQLTGEQERATERFRGAAAIYERKFGPRHSSVGNALAGLGLALQDAGDAAGARTILERAVDICETSLGPDHPALARALTSLALVLRNQGEIPAAIPLMERAVRIEEASLADHQSLASHLRHLGILYAIVNEFDAAERHMRRAVDMHERHLGERHVSVVADLNAWGTLMMWQGRVAEARPMYERALRIVRDIEGPEGLEATLVYNLAQVAKNTGNFDVALERMRESLAIRERTLPPGHPDVAESLSELGEWLIEAGEPKESIDALRRAADVLTEVLGAAHPRVATARTLEALASARIGDPRAFELVLQTEEHVRRHLRLTVRGLAEEQALGYTSARPPALDLVVTLALEGEDGSERVARGWDALVRSRTLVLDEVADRQRLIRATGDPETRALTASVQEARTELANLVLRGPRGDTDEFSEAVEASRRRGLDLERRLASLGDRYRAATEREEIGLEEVSRSLPQDAVLVAYHRFRRLAVGTGDDDPPRADTQGTPWYVAFVLVPGQAPRVVDLGASETIDAAVTEWRSAVGEAGSGRVALRGGPVDRRYRQIGSRLRELVWDPVVAIAGDRELALVVPDAALHLVSLATLPGADGRYVVESGPAVHYVSAERDVPVRPEPTAGKGILVVGGPDFDGSPADPRLPSTDKADAVSSEVAVVRGAYESCETLRSLEFAPLPGAAAEADTVRALWRADGDLDGGDAESGVVTLTGSGASEAAVKRLIAGRRVLHLATHGFYIDSACGGDPSLPSTNPLLVSGLAFAGANRRGDAVSSEDGILTALEIGALDLSGVEWAVVSGCRTGTGEIRDGEGVLGLRRAFETAGARTLILSLWPVEDRNTREWMRELYLGRRDGLSASDAVRRASTALLEARRAAGKSTHPYFWGAFVAAGDWR